MAKCNICNSKKGKRDCRMTGGVVCSLCCGMNRTPEKCGGCEFMKNPAESRRYSNVPRYLTSEMDIDLDKQQWTNAIESEIVAFDLYNDRKLKDRDALRIVELLLDWLYFEDDEDAWMEKIASEGYEHPISVIVKDCRNANQDDFVRCLGTVYHVAKRRTKGRREYLDFIHNYVGPRVEEGVRTLPNTLFE